MTALIALTGAPGVGKDTVARIIQAASPQTRAIAFADALRREVVAAWGIDLAMLTEPATKEHPITALAADRCAHDDFCRWLVREGCDDITAPRSPRWVMQQWGSYQRSKNPQHYIHIVREHIRLWTASPPLKGGYQRAWTAPEHPMPAHITHPPQAVVTDLRYPNEATMLRAQGAKIIRITRPDATLLSADTANHSSEQHQGGGLPADAIISNHGTLHHLTAEVARTLATLATPQADAA